MGRVHCLKSVAWYTAQACDLGSAVDNLRGRYTGQWTSPDMDLPCTSCCFRTSISAHFKFCLHYQVVFNDLVFNIVDWEMRDA